MLLKITLSPLGPVKVITGVNHSTCGLKGSSATKLHQAVNAAAGAHWSHLVNRTIKTLFSFFLFLLFVVFFFFFPKSLFPRMNNAWTWVKRPPLFGFLRGHGGEGEATYLLDCWL